MSNIFKETVETLQITDKAKKKKLKSILSVVSTAYPDAPVKNYIETEGSKIPSLAGIGFNPVELIQVYEGKDHYAFLSAFFSNLIDSELSFRVPKVETTELDRYKDLVGHVAGAITSVRLKLDMMASIFYLDEKYQTENIKAVLILKDPILRPDPTVHGFASYRLIFGITEEVYRRLVTPSGGIFIQPMREYLDQEFDKNPSMISQP